MNTQYKETIVDTVIKILKSNLPPGYFKEFYYGDPINIPTSLLPCVMVSKDKTRIIQGPTGMDLLEYPIRIQLAYNKKNELGKSASEVIGVRTLEQYAEGRDPSTGEFSENTVAGILRKNFTLGNVATDQTIDIDYGLVMRPDKSWTGECQIKCVIQEYVSISGRT